VDQYADSSRVFSPLVLDSWLALLQADPQARARFAASLSSPTQATYTLLALSRLCQHPYMTLNYIGHDPTPFVAPVPSSSPAVGESGSVTPSIPTTVVRRSHESVDDATGLVKTDLPFIFALELFQVAFIDANTRNDIFKPSLDYFTAVTARHPRAVSLLLALTYYHFKYIQKASLPLFNCLDLSLWRPTSNDMRMLEALLLTSADTPGSFLARFVLQRLNYSMEEPAVTPVANEVESKSRSVFGGSSGASIHGSAPLAPRDGPNPVLGWEFHRSMMLMLAAVRFTHLQPPTTLTTRFMRVKAAATTGGVSYVVTSFTPFPSLPRLTFPSLAWGINEGDGSDSRRPMLPLHYEPLSSAGGVTGNAAAAVEYITGPMRISLTSPVAVWWTDILLRLHVRDQCGRPATAPLHTWICSLFDIDASANESIAVPPTNTPSSTLERRATLFSRSSVVDEEKSVRDRAEKAYASRMELVKTDPVLSYVQLQLTWHSSDIRRFNIEGWPMIRQMISLTPSQPAYHPLAFRLVHDILPVMLRLAEANSVFAAWPHTGMPAAPPSSGPFLDAPNAPSSSTSNSKGGMTGETGGGDDNTLLSIVHSFFDASRPRGLYSIFNKLSGKVPFSDYAVGLAHVAGAHLLSSSVPSSMTPVQRSRSPFYSAFATMANSPYASSQGWMPTSRWIDYWLSEITYYEQSSSGSGSTSTSSTTGGTSGGSNSGVLPQGQWMKDPSCRYLVDFLCRAVFISSPALFDPTVASAADANNVGAGAVVPSSTPRPPATDAVALLLAFISREAGRPTFVDDFIAPSGGTVLRQNNSREGGASIGGLGESKSMSVASSSSSSSHKSILIPPSSLFKDMKPTEWCPQYG
jgi:hypothetical protein